MAADGAVERHELELELKRARLKIEELDLEVEELDAQLERAQQQLRGQAPDPAMVAQLAAKEEELAAERTV
eukprot:COSAG01_NODE_38544_length_488_cov_1.000000_1_plen_70_part_10